MYVAVAVVESVGAAVLPGAHAKESVPVYVLVVAVLGVGAAAKTAQ